MTTVVKCVGIWTSFKCLHCNCINSTLSVFIYAMHSSILLVFIFVTIFLLLAELMNILRSKVTQQTYMQPISLDAALMVAKSYNLLSFLLLTFNYACTRLLESIFKAFVILLAILMLMFALQ